MLKPLLLHNFTFRMIYNFLIDISLSSKAVLIIIIQMANFKGLDLLNNLPFFGIHERISTPINKSSKIAL